MGNEKEKHYFRRYYFNKKVAAKRNVTFEEWLAELELKQKRIPPPASNNPTIKHIPLTQGKFAQVDAHNYEWLMQYSWHALKSEHTFYAGAGVGESGKRLKMHQMVLEKKIGRELLTSELPDHKNRDGLCNLEKNLRVASRLKNSWNRKKPNKTGYMGVSGRKRGRVTFEVNITVEGKVLYLGAWNSVEEAARAYDAAARYYFGEFACTNFEGDEKASASELKVRAVASRQLL